MIRYGLIGKPLSHSFSQRYFTEKFEREGLVDHRYDLFELDSIDELRALVSETSGLRGLNVTIPFKQTVLPLLDAVDRLAAAVGAVNTIRVEGGKLIGFNTDVEGFRQTLMPLLQGRKPRALVLGSGGASRAVAFVLKELGIKFRVVSRSRERGDMTYDLVEPIVVDVCTLIINTTPLGMHPDTASLPPIPYEAIGPKHVLIDLVYNPERTAFLSEGQRRGAAIANGSQMLRAQAEASWRIWNGL
ncbi:MAG: shikimate dehydrogenase [Flavobacteriales bacterium]|nr:shikimate dehydrogenase [Flavobacteriales bacterium]